MNKTLGPYVLQEEIGYGGMATVYRAHQPSIDRDVAVKVILRTRLEDQESVQRFQREARLIARLEHPHILPVYDFDGRHDPPYIVMRYLDSGTLREIMGRGPMPINEAVYLTQQIGSALDYAHRQGIVHRDIKPSNIMLDQDGNAFVTDFGIARMVSSAQHITATGALMGTPAYMSPEQAQGRSDLDHRTDIYALGVIVFQMLTGELPYSHDNNFSVLMMHVNHPIPNVLQLNPDLPPAADAVLRRALAKTPDERFQSASELVHALNMAVGGTISTTPTRLRMLVSDGKTLTSRQQGSTDRSTGSRPPSEQNKTITALYAGAGEYAEIVDELYGSEAARKALKSLWTAVDQIVEAHGGLITTQTEDATLALWGAETAREDDTERAIRAALAIQDVMVQQSTKYFDEDDEEPLPLNIALNTGLVLLTPHEDTDDITASGATISLTYRLMQQADGLILATHSTYSQVRGIFEMEPDTPLKLRRSRSTIPVYRVKTAKPRAFRRFTRGIEGIETRMIGREAELKTLQNAYLDALEDEETQAVTIVSEAGLGKSRMLYEFANWSDFRPELFRIFRGRATPEMTSRPYALFRDIISFRFQILDNDPPSVAQEKLEEGIHQLSRPNPELAHLIGHLAGFDFTDSAYLKGLADDPQQLTERARQSFFRWIAEVSQQDPVVFELEDIHLADDASLDLLTDLMTQYDELSLLVICLARPSLYERRPTWGSGQAYHTRLDLRPLDRRESRSLVRELLQKVPHVPKKLRDLIVDRAEGNPFYMEELVKMLIDDRVILKQSDETWIVEEDRLGYLNVPTTLIGLLQARLDSLLYPEKLTLYRAAVIGRVFYDTALEALDTVDDIHVEGLPDILDRLVEQEFILQRETTAFAGSTEYIFGKAMLQDVLLNSLLRSQQERYNTAAAEWLLQVSSERVSEYFGLIADYYEKAGEYEHAAHYLQLTGDQAMAISAFNEARGLFERALTLLPTESEIRLVLYLRLGATRYYLSDYQSARKSLQSALKSARALEDDGSTADALYWLSQTAVMEGYYEQAQTYLEESVHLARTGTDAEILTRALYGLGDLYWRQGQSEDAQSVLNESLGLARQIGNVTQELFALNRLGSLAVTNGEWDEADDYYVEMLAKAREVGNRERETSALNNLGVVAYERGDLQTCLDYTNQALPLAREVGNLHFIVLLLSNLADISLRLENLDDAQTYLKECITVASQIGSLPYLLTGVQTAGVLIGIQGDRERGLTLIGLSINHPTTTTEHQRTAVDCLRALNADRDDPEVEALLAKGKALDLEKVAKEILAEWEEEPEA